MKKALATVVLGTLLLTACSSWPTIIGAAQAIAMLGGAVDPGLASLSSLAVQLLHDVDQAVAQVQKNKNPTTIIAVEHAIEAIDTQLPNALQQLQVSPVVKARAETAITIILDYVDRLAAQQPEISRASIARQRAQRTSTPVPAKPLDKKEIERRWTEEVCGGAPECAQLIKGPRYWPKAGANATSDKNDERIPAGGGGDPAGDNPARATSVTFTR